MAMAPQVDITTEELLEDDESDLESKSASASVSSSKDDHHAEEYKHGELMMKKSAKK